MRSACGVFVLFAAAAAVELYVDGVAGSDSNSGTKGSPFKTIQKAQQAARKGNAGGTTVFINGSTIYDLSASPLAFTVADSGTASAPVVYRTLPGSPPARLSAGKVVTAQAASEDATARAALPESILASVMVANLKAQGITSYGKRKAGNGGYDHDCVGNGMEFFFGGKALEVARYPNLVDEGTNCTQHKWERTLGGKDDQAALSNSTKLKTKRKGSCKHRLVDQGISCEEQSRTWKLRNGIKLYSDNSNETVSTGGSSFKFPAGAPYAKWKDMEDVWVHGTWANEWNDCYNKVESITGNEMKIGPPKSEDGPITAPGAKFYVLNSMDALDAPGEFYLQRSSGKLYFIPPTANDHGSASTTATTEAAAVAIDSIEAMVSVGSNVVTFTGTKYVTLQGLVIEASTQQAVVVKGSTGVVVQQCEVRNSGTHGIVVTDGKNCVIDGNDIHHVGGRGVDIEAGDSDSLTAANHCAKNNLIHHFERVCFTYNPAVYLDGVGNTARNNEIWHSPHHAIEPEGNDQTATFNIIHHVTCDTFDNGAIYWAPTNWANYNYNLSYNLIHHIGFKSIGCNTDTSCMRVGIYCDDGAIGGVIEGNVIYSPKMDFDTSDPKGFQAVDTWAIFTNGGRDWTIKNNLALDQAFMYVGCAGLSWNDDMKDNSGDYYTQLKDVHYTTPPYSARYPKLAALDDFYKKSGKPACAARQTCPAAPYGMSIDSNIAVNASATKSIETKPIILPADAEGAGNGDPSCKDFANTKVDVAKNLIGTDPGFVSADPRGSLDFRLKSSSPAFGMGFKAIPLDRIGP
jgi:hypothetical protein